MNAPAAIAVLGEVRDHLVKALALLDENGLGNVAAPHIELGLHHVLTQLTGLSLPVATRSVG